MPRRNYVLEEWNRYVEKVFPAAPHEQRRALRNAFFAGAWSLHNAVMWHLSAGPEATEEDLRIMKDIEEEFREYAEKVKRGTD